MTRKSAAPQVPGAPVVEQSTQVPGAPDAAETPAPVAKDAPEAETVTVSKASLDALLARVQALEANAAAPSAEKRVASQSAELPDQDSIDPAIIKRPVLTQQGYVVPENFGSNPNAPKAF